jgi:DNA-binding LacI/PurR family transcriptional regulator/biotin operon repressor
MEDNRLLSDKVKEELAQRTRQMGPHGAEHRISERALAKSLGMSRGPIRSALAELEKEGLVVRERGRGTRILSKRRSSIGSAALIFGSGLSSGPARAGIAGLFARLEGVSVALGTRRVPTILCPAHGYVSDALETGSACTAEAFAERLAARVSAVIMVEWHYYCVEVAQELEKRSFPYVVVNLEEEADVRSVIIDHRDVGRRAAEFMVKCGYRSAMCLLGSRRRFLFQQLAQGFEEVWGERKLQIVECHGLAESARTALASVYNEGQKPEAVFSYGDERTLGVLDALRERNVNVPDQTGVLCYGRTSPLTREADVTGFAEPYLETGRMAVKVLEGLSTGQILDRKMVVSAPFVLGRTMVF